MRFRGIGPALRIYDPVEDPDGWRELRVHIADALRRQHGPWVIRNRIRWAVTEERFEAAIQSLYRWAERHEVVIDPLA